MKAKLDFEVKRLKKELESTKSTTSTKITDLTAELTEIKQEREKLTSQLNSERKAKETEVAVLKKKITSLEKAGQNTKRMNEMKETYDEKILSTVLQDLQFIFQMYYGFNVTKFSDLENEIKKHQHEQETLTKQYQELTNSKLQIERENESLNR